MAGIWDLIKGISASDVALAGLGTAAYTTQQQALEDFAKRGAADYRASIARGSAGLDV
jgi:hypothetical protein